MEKDIVESVTSFSSPFHLMGLLPTTGQQWIDTVAAITVERILGLNKLEAVYQLVGYCHDCDDFISKACAVLDIEAHFPDRQLTHIPATGPVVVVANHPFGCIDGLLLARILRQVRKDVRILSNYLLKKIPELSELIITVDPFNGPPAQNAIGLRRALRWLRSGGLILVFPAGEVSHWQYTQKAITDPLWNTDTARLIHLTQASVVPIHIRGNNSLAFQLAGLLHPRLRTLLLVKELLNKVHTHVTLRIGQPLSYIDMKHMEVKPLTKYVRLQTYLLGEPDKNPKVLKKVKTINEITTIKYDLCTHEVEKLPPEQKLAESSEFAVYIADADQIPELLQEIGRQRELVFRVVGEGTGLTIDLDSFDADYLHLFVWHKQKRELVGAYRLGLVDQIMRRRGSKGLYTYQLFEMHKRLFEQMGPAIELGRAFIVTKYQRELSPLFLLWKALCSFVANNPYYRVLFGPVSISNDYVSSSRQLIVDYLQSTLLDHDIARWVKPRNNPVRRHKLWQIADLGTFGDIEGISSLITGVEPDGKGVPILLRKYLKIGGRILGISVDRKFNNAIDALIMVDLTLCDLKFLQRYMGQQQAISYLSHHKVLGLSSNEAHLSPQGCVS